MWFLVPNTVDVPFADECMDFADVVEAWVYASFLNRTGRQFGMAVRVISADDMEAEQLHACERVYENGGA
jgi:hypothetical protein